MHSRTLFGIAALCAVLAGCGTESPRPDLAFAPDALPGAVLGQPYSVAIAVSGNETPVHAMEVLQGSLPPGIVLVHRSVQATGLLEGAPEQAGTFAFTI